MHAERILAATDFSDASEAALRYAGSLARDTGAALLIVHVQPSPTVVGGEEIYSEAQRADDRLLREALQRVRPPDERVPVEHHLLLGDPAKEIVRFAEEKQVDFIVVGSHGRGALSRFLLGGVAESVLRKATCPVITVKVPLE